MVKTNKKIVSSLNEDIKNSDSIISEETKKTVANLLGRAVKDYMNESIINEANEDEDEDEFEEINNGEETEVADTVSAEEAPAENLEGDDEAETDPESSETAEIDIEANAENGDGWAEFEDFKTDDNEYDLSGSEDDEKVIKIFKLLQNDDQVVFKQNGDSIELKDNETGAEYKIEMGGDCEGEECSPNSDDLDDEDDDSLLEINLSKIAKMIKENDLGYTDNYQDKDAIAGLSMNDGNSSQTKDWHKGVPTGTTKPWAGKGDSQPFDETITEGDDTENVEAFEDGEGSIEEITTVTSNNARKMPKTHTSVPRSEHLPQGSKTISAGGEYKGSVSEDVIKKAKVIYENYKKALNKIDEIQKDYKEALKVINSAKNYIAEATLVNVNLGKIVKLMTEHSTSKEEKNQIINRFTNEATTVDKSNMLYESIKNELSKNKGNQINLVTDKSLTVPKQISETKIYQSEDMMQTLDLMKRVGKC